MSPTLDIDPNHHSFLVVLPDVSECLVDAQPGLGSQPVFPSSENGEAGYNFSNSNRPLIYVGKGRLSNAFIWITQEGKRSGEGMGNEQNS